MTLIVDVARLSKVGQSVLLIVNVIKQTSNVTKNVVMLLAKPLCNKPAVNTNKAFGVGHETELVHGNEGFHNDFLPAAQRQRVVDEKETSAVKR